MTTNQTTDHTPEELRSAAQVLEELYKNESWYELPLSEQKQVYFGFTVDKLRKLAEVRTPKPFSPKVYVRRDDDNQVTVFVENEENNSITAVYTHRGWVNSSQSYDNNRLGTFIGDTDKALIFGGDK